jgi:hypothetical protein
MPDIVWSNYARQQALYLLQEYQPGVTVHLFDNNYTVVPATVLADVTEASYPGYAAINWIPGLPSIVSPNIAQWAPQAFLFPSPSSGSPVDIYGFYVTFQSRYAGGDKLMQGARFLGAPLTLTVGGGGLFFTILNQDYDINNP